MKHDDMILETGRLILRRFRESDLQDLHEYLSDPEVVRFEPYKPKSLAEAREDLAWRVSTEEMTAVELKGSGKMIGNVYLGRRDFLSLEIGYVFNRRYWGRGFAAESCRALIRRAFSQGVHRVFAECDPQNESSWRLLEALGFRREGHFLQNVYFRQDGDGRPIWKDTYVYGLLGREQGPGPKKM